MRCSAVFPHFGSRWLVLDKKSYIQYPLLLWPLSNYVLGRGYIFVATWLVHPSPVLSVFSLHPGPWYPLVLSRANLKRERRVREFISDIPNDIVSENNCV